MPTVTTSKIQVRRGPLSDLPILDEGEFGYALDYHRLFIGNTPLSFTGNGHTKHYTVQDRTILPDQISVLVDNSEVNIGVEYRLEETDIVFTNAPHAAEEVLYTVVGHEPTMFVGNNDTNSLSIPSYTDGSEVVVISYKNHDPLDYVPLSITKVYAHTDSNRPNQIEVSSTAGLEERQLFVLLNTAFAASGVLGGRNYYIRSIVDSTHITISRVPRDTIPSNQNLDNQPAQVIPYPAPVEISTTTSGIAYSRAKGNHLQHGENYIVNASAKTITFLDGSIPEGPADVKINFNTEVKVQNSLDPHFRLPLNGSVSVPANTGLSVSIAESNTVFIDYSLRTSDNILRVGTIRVITDGENIQLQENRTTANCGITFNFKIESNRLYLTYTNSRTQSANFYYSVKLWNTI